MIFIKRSKYFLAFTVIAVFLSACDSSRVFDKFKDIKDGLWNHLETVKFDVPLDDSVSYHKVFINVRNRGDYKFSNLFMFLKTTYPDGKISRDTIDCLLADDKGKWLGKGLGDLKDCQYLLKKGVRFHQKGVYTFEFEQAMRVEKLEGIESIGIRIEKMK
jgi:gliding motility-associated lipoprotein GldH